MRWSDVDLARRRISVRQVVVKVGSRAERLGHHSPAFTQSTYQHLLPGMGEAAARRFEDLVLERDEPEPPSRARRALLSCCS